MFDIGTSGLTMAGAAPKGRVLIVRSGFAAGSSTGTCEATELAFTRRQGLLEEVTQRLALVTGETTRLINSLRR